LTRLVTIIALTCFLVVGAAATSILGGGGLPMVGSRVAPAMAERLVSNAEAKRDRLAVAGLALASLESQPAPVDSSPADPLRPALAPSVSAVEALNAVVSPTAPATPQAPSVPKLASKPAPTPAPQQKSYALLSDAQIAGIKDRLKLSPDQESYWPGVENALRAIARKLHATRQADPHAAMAAIDPDSAEVQQLKSAAMPLLFQLREDQKREVRALARLIGLEQVAAAI
jgi:hypothetical protein